MYKLFSYDIFDTCLVRSCGDPLVVFDILAFHILPGADTTQLMDFALERKNGEAKARQKYIKGMIEEISLAQIYDCCDFSIWTSKCKDEILNKELEIERQLLVPVHTILKEIELLRKQGVQIAFISDMYLPLSFIKEVLLGTNLYHEGDMLYVSSETKLTKHTGHLFQQIAKTHKIKYKEWKHKGDHPKSDIMVPKKLGIKVEQINHIPSRFEKFIESQDCSSDFMYQKMLAGLCKSLRLSSKGSPEEIVAITFVAPFFVPFVYRLLKKSRELCIKKLFFLARDAYIFYIIAIQFQNEFPEIELKYINVSRKSLYLPALKSITYPAIANMFWNFEQISVSDIIERLQINDYNYTKWENNSFNSSEILNGLLKDEHFIECVAKKRDEQKELITRYLIQEGLGGDNCAIVDLTGTRRCHLAINSILLDKDLKPVFGFYYSVMGNRSFGNDYWSLNFIERYDRNLRNCSLFPQELFEQYFCITDQRRTASYYEKNNTIYPLFEEDPTNFGYCKRIHSINKKYCIIFAKQYLLMFQRANTKMLSNTMMSTFSYFYNVPDKYTIRTFDELIISDSKNNGVLLLEKCGFINSCIQKNTYWKNALIMKNFCFPSILQCILELMYNHGDLSKGRKTMIKSIFSK